MTPDARWSARTFGNEDRLPRLPMPPLEDTCERFISWCVPLMTAEELAATEIAVHSFQAADGPGRKLNHALKEAAHGAPSWLDTFWASRFLGQRGRIALDANYFFLLADSTIPGDPGEPQISRAAALTAAAAHYKLRLDAELVAPVLRHGRPVSMEQHKHLFSTTRIPGAEHDTLRTPYTGSWPGPSQARHVVVICRGALFRLEVIGPDAQPCPPAQLAAGLRTIRAACPLAAAAGSRATQPSAPAVGSLTSQPRAGWAASQAALLTCDPGNAGALDTVQTALFCLCLEDVTPTGARDACDHLLHGDSANRWYDKALSLIVFADGTAGINVERSAQDPATIQDFLGTLTVPPAEDPPPAPPGGGQDGGPAVQPVHFVLDDKLAAAAAAAAEDFAAHASRTLSVLVPFDDFGTETARRLGASPDAFVQLACQLAHSRARGKVGTTRESVSTRRYRHGRTEPMRVVTPEIVGFVAAMDDPLVDAVTRRARFRAAEAKHVERVRDCQAGHAPEQHLHELWFIQQRSGAAVGVPVEPELYRTPGWRVLRENFLSTGPASSPSAEYFGFGPAGRKDIGVGYVLQPDRCQVYLSAHTAVAKEVRAFARHFRTAVAEMRELLAGQ